MPLTEILIGFAILFGVMFAVVRIYILISDAKDKKNKLREEERKIKEIKEDIIETKTVKYIDFSGKEKDVSFNVIENNGGILKLSKIDKSLDVIQTDASMSGRSNNDISVSIGHLGYVGEYKCCVNNNNFCIFSNKGKEYDYYIDVNDISKIDIHIFMGSRINAYNGDNYFTDFDVSDMEKISFTIYTKSGASFDNLEHDISCGFEVKKAIEIIKKVNNNIIFTYQYTVYMTSPIYHAIKYEFGDKLNIKSYEIESSAVETFLTDDINYEINIDYSSIIELDMTNFESNWLSVNVCTKENSKYELIFSDNEEATKFYNELKKH